MADPNAIRRYEFKSDRSYKFWEVSVDDLSVNTRYGRIGTRGRSQSKIFDSAEAAQAHADKEAAKKKKAGYVELVKQEVKRKTNEELWNELKPHEPFLESILESPDDIDQYLVYADWLLECGDPRGQFILSQLAAKDSQTPMWEQIRHQKIADEIQLTNWREWLGELAPILQPSGFRLEFQRGQVSLLGLPCLNSQIGVALKGSPHCRFLRTLEVLSTNPSELYNDEEDAISREADTGLEPLLGADFANLRTLELTYNHFGRRRLPGRKTFEVIHTMPRLRKLSITGSIAAGDYQFLFDKEMPNLEELIIEDQFGNGPIEALCESDWMEQLVSLKLVCDLENSIAQNLAERLNPNVMERIDVTQNNINEEGLNTIRKTGVSVVSFF